MRESDVRKRDARTVNRSGPQIITSLSRPNGKWELPVPRAAGKCFSTLRQCHFVSPSVVRTQVILASRSYLSVHGKRPLLTRRSSFVLFDNSADRHDTAPAPPPVTQLLRSFFLLSLPGSASLSSQLFAPPNLSSLLFRPEYKASTITT